MAWYFFCMVTRMVYRCIDGGRMRGRTERNRTAERVGRQGKTGQGKGCGLLRFGYIIPIDVGETN